MQFGMRLEGVIWNNLSKYVYPDFAYFTYGGDSKCNQGCQPEGEAKLTHFSRKKSHISL